ncbi:hypothetical protein, partial [Bacillus pseudomycoides]|uniref:hypothetical protein n=1 Tax=Bacillus pseudomycoides TaxID=64104 RepID=UPI00142EEC9B
MKTTAFVGVGGSSRATMRVVAAGSDGPVWPVTKIPLWVFCCWLFKVAPSVGFQPVANAPVVPSNPGSWSRLLHGQQP